MFIDCHNQVMNLPEFVELFWWDLLCKVELMVDCHETSVRHVLVEAKRADILVLIKGDVYTPKVR